MRHPAGALEEPAALPWGDDLPQGCAWFEAAAARLLLMPERAAFDPGLSLLMVADVHVGKALAFRRRGVPVPGGTTQETLLRLDQALVRTGARRLVILGDLLHSAAAQGSSALEALLQWRRRRPALALTLVRGNHDRQSGDLPCALDIEVVDGPWPCGPWVLDHEPVEPGDDARTRTRLQASAGYRLAGHVHPGVVIPDPVGGRWRLPAFRFGRGQGVLPAFGAFTGLHIPRTAAGERVFAVVPSEPGARPDRDGPERTDVGRVVAWPAP